MKIRQYNESDKADVINICLKNADIDDGLSETAEYIKQMFCLYYIENETDNSYVAVDDSGKVIGYIYGTADFNKYKEAFTLYLERIAALKNSAYIADAYAEMYNHYIYSSDYPAHFHIDILDGYRGGGIGAKLIKTYCNNLYNKGVNGVMLIVGSDNTAARRFYEQNGFQLISDKPLGAAYGYRITEDK